MPNVKTRTYVALAASLSRANPAAEIDSKGYVADVAQNFIRGIRPAVQKLALADLALGDGHDDKVKVRAAHSSAMLALNTFAPWRARPVRFPLLRRPDSVKFERKLSMGLRGRMLNLDLVAESSSAVVAVESKCTEQLDVKDAVFSPRVVERMREPRRSHLVCDAR